MAWGEGSLPEVVAEGDRRASLEAIRDRLAAELDTDGHKRSCECECGVTATDGRVIAMVAGRLVDVIRELDALPNGREVSTVDDLAARRAARRQGTTGLPVS